jgi:hypothetical protein
VLPRLKPARQCPTASPDERDDHQPCLIRIGVAALKHTERDTGLDVRSARHARPLTVRPSRSLLPFEEEDLRGASPVRVYQQHEYPGRPVIRKLRQGSARACRPVSTGGERRFARRNPPLIRFVRATL